MHDTRAVVVTWHSEGRIAACLDALLESLPASHVIVVDNSLDDATASVVEQGYPGVTVVRTGENLGFGRACNIGMRWALDRDARYVIQVNDDAIMDGDACRTLVEVAERNPDYGFLAPLNVAREGGPLDPLFLQEMRMNARRGMVSRMLSDALLGRSEDVYPVGVIPGAILLVRGDCLRELGGCDPLYFLYGSEYDLCRRAETSRWKVGVVPASVVVHDYVRTPDRRPRARLAKSVTDSHSISLLFAKRPGWPFLFGVTVALLAVPFRVGYALLVMRDAPRALGIVLAVPGFVAVLPRVWHHRRRCRTERSVFLDDIDPAILPAG